MIMPLESLINFSGNAYELAAAIAVRAYQLAVLRTPEVEKNNGKVVSMSTQEILEKTIGYKFIAS
ncbi:MAG TPA: DNA-directed RNA polymerase subunit omega [Rectinema sp.]|nr:DNA-directed RNA polymerase subunit omega [Rectinema sp.]HPY04490.1 DNA-directed RNA polymerase subunit omega [Rectinema sp.]